MTRVTYTQIEVTKNPLMKVAIEVPQWEAHVVLALWGDDANVTGTVVREREFPEVGDEFARLVNKYGPRDEDIPAVAKVYGSFGPGLRGLENEFKASIAGATGKSVVDAAPVATADQVTIIPQGKEILAGVEVAQARDAIAPAVLAGFEGSKAPIDARADAVVDAGADANFDKVLTDSEIDALDVPSLQGNTVEGVAIEDYMNDVSDLIGEGEPDPQAA